MKTFLKKILSLNKWYYIAMALSIVVFAIGATSQGVSVSNVVGLLSMLSLILSFGLVGLRGFISTFLAIISIDIASVGANEVLYLTGMSPMTPFFLLLSGYLLFIFNTYSEDRNGDLRLRWLWGLCSLVLSMVSMIVILHLTQSFVIASVSLFIVTGLMILLWKASMNWFESTKIIDVGEYEVLYDDNIVIYTLSEKYTHLKNDNPKKPVAIFSKIGWPNRENGNAWLYREASRLREEGKFLVLLSVASSHSGIIVLKSKNSKLELPVAMLSNKLPDKNKKIEEFKELTEVY